MVVEGVLDPAMQAVCILKEPCRPLPVAERDRGASERVQRERLGLEVVDLAGLSRARRLTPRRSAAGDPGGDLRIQAQAPSRRCHSSWMSLAWTGMSTPH